MAEYIDREEVMKIAKDGNHSDFGRSMADLTSLREVLEDTPTADVAEVVRCRDCRYRGNSDICPMFHLCYSFSKGYYWEDFTMDNKFCSYGARMDGKE